jgi:hypothetical protein
MSGKDELAGVGSEERVQHVYTFPAKFCEFKNVTIVELTANEELMAASRAGTSQVRLAWELAKQSVWAVDGKQLYQHDGSLDKFWNRVAPKVRQLILSAYSDVHNPAEEIVKDFLKSHAITA